MSVSIGRGQLMLSKNYRGSVSSQRTRAAQWFKRHSVLHSTIPAPPASSRVRKQCNRLNKTWLPSTCRRSLNLNCKGHSPSLTRFRHPIGARTDSGGKCESNLLAYLSYSGLTHFDCSCPMNRALGTVSCGDSSPNYRTLTV